MKKRLVAFDIYKTCLSALWEERLFPFIVEKFDLQEQFKAVVDAFLTIQAPAQEIIWKFVDLSLLPEREVEEIFTSYDERVNQVLSAVDFFPETLSTLQKLKQQGYAIAAVSNVSARFLMPIEQLLWNMFDYTLLSCKIGMKKPDGKIFELLKQQSWCHSEEILMVGDSIKSDVEGAKSAGIDALWINRDGRKEPVNYPTITSLDKVFDFL